MSKPLNNIDLDAALTEARQSFLDTHPETVAAHEAACASMPGGNTRTVLFHDPVPLRVARGEGAWLTDVDGHRYLNLVGEYSAGIFGHNHPRIAAAVTEALRDGVNLSGHNTREAELAARLCERFPSIDLIRFTNSGTEANLMAISTARVFTGREKVMVMDGGYHGGLLYFAGGGIPINAPYSYVLGAFNDVEATRSQLRAHADELACVLVEPMMGAGGCIPARLDFLAMLREETQAAGVLLIFDEVMTSRFPDGGAQGYFGVTPDMTTLGKYLGGGMTFGAFGGRHDIMALYDPTRPEFLPHAGTFNNNSVTMAAGIAGLEIFTPAAAGELHDRGERLRSELNHVFQKTGAELQATGLGSFIGIHPTRVSVTSLADTHGLDERRRYLLFFDLLGAGFYMAKRGYIALSLAINEDDLARLVDTTHDLISRRGSLYRA